MVHRVGTLVAAISANAQERSAGVVQIGQSVTELDQIAQPNAELVRELSDSAPDHCLQTQSLAEPEYR
ncbi:hypothetical protein ACW4YW_04645 [Methylobacillus pratensis]